MRAPTNETGVRELTPLPTACVRVRAATSELGDLFDKHLPNIAERLADLGAEPAGPPYGRYHDYGAERVDVEIGIPVKAPVGSLRTIDEAEEGELAAGELPGGPAAVAVHIGPYDSLNRTYERLHTWIHEQGREEGTGPWELYVTDPAEVDDPAELRTEVYWPLG